MLKLRRNVLSPCVKNGELSEQPVSHHTGKPSANTKKHHLYHIVYVHILCTGLWTLVYIGPATLRGFRLKKKQKTKTIVPSKSSNSATGPKKSQKKAFKYIQMYSYYFLYLYALHIHLALPVAKAGKIQYFKIVCDMYIVCLRSA